MPPRCIAARSSSISVTGVVSVMNTPIAISCSTGRDSSALNSRIDAISTQPAPSVVPIVGACTRA